MTGSRSRLGALFLALLLPACGGDPAAPGRLRLWTLPGAELVSVPAGERRELLRENFAGGLEGWIGVSNPLQPHLSDEGALRVETGSEEDLSFLSLSGRHGGFSRLLEVEPGACYEFEGRVRARGIEPEVEPFNGATFWLGEMEEELPLEELLREGAPQRISAHHLFPGARETSGWLEHRVLFQAGPRAHRLWVVCVLGTTEDVRAGTVDFTGIRLCRVPPEVYWEDRVERAIERRAAVDPPLAASHERTGRGDWRERRVVSATLGAEARPSIVLLPGERLRFSLAVPRGARLTAGLGTWRVTHVEGRSGEQRFSLRLARETASLLPVPVSAAADEADWTELDLDLSRWADRTVELELELAGDEPGVLGAPEIRPAPLQRSGANLVLVSIDTLRADHVGAYGYVDPTRGASPTPVLDQMAREGLLCADASSQAPYTLPAHATLFSGQFPSVHGVVTGGRTVSAARTHTLARILAEQGLTTQAFTAGGFLSTDFGLDQGFDGFASVDPLRDTAAARGKDHQDPAPAAEVRQRLQERYGFDGVLRWLEAHQGERFFLFLHTYVVHNFDPPPGYLRCREQGCRSQVRRYHRQGATREEDQVAPKDLAHLVHLYDAALASVDERIGRLLARLDELGLSTRTVIVVTSDHGEELLEHGAIQHGKTLYEELLRVPLILRIPGLAPRVLERPVMLADVAPTCLAAMGSPVPSRMQGVDLRSGDWPERPIWSEVDDAFAHKYSLREPDGWKLVHGPPSEGLRNPNTRAWELYHLGRDPLEREDLAQSEEATRRRLAELLEAQRARLEELGAGLGALGEGSVDERTLDELEALGYAR